MHHILLVVPKSDTNDYEYQRRWEGCTANLKNIASKSKEIQMLGENVALLSLQNTLDVLAEVVRNILGLSYKYLILDEEIEWHEVSKQV